MDVARPRTPARRIALNRYVWWCAAFCAACQGAPAPADRDNDTVPPTTAAPVAPRPGAAAPDTATSPGAATALTAEGWGSLRIGMTLDEVVAAAGADANPEAVGGPEPEYCDQFRPARAPGGMLVMIEQGRLTRISISAPAAVKTDRGRGVGDAASAITAAYGDDAVVSPHKYVGPPAAYITIWAVAPPGAAARGIRYEIGDDGRVAHVHAGGPSIEYVEGCL